MKTLTLWICALLSISLLAGCTTAGSGGSTNNSAVKVSGYVDTSVQKNF